MEPRFRPAGESDVDRLLGFMRSLYAVDLLPFDASASRPVLERIVRDASLGSVWLVEIEGEPVGYVVLTLGYSLEYLGRDAVIDELYVDPAWRHRGIGSKTIEFVVDVCRSRGVRSVHLGVHEKNLRAQALYRRAG
ncbi:MAG TPA: GNAT family N-acetyltransferase, partial [Candidatus Polarisedimenticolia bacterium]|nr:GNAT family N-acetyltransferase [Candidatus Polarisedimenticolia bacterium]